MMYDAYLRFPRAFYDRHATGEVISRATNDIYPVRYFIGWGVVQAIQSVMMLIGAAIVLTLGQRPADALRRARDAADRGPDVPLRPQGVPDLARRAGEEGPPDRGDRRGGRRDRDGAGVRPRGRRPRALHRPGRGRPRRDDAPGRHRGALPARADLPAVARRSPPCCTSAAATAIDGRPDDRAVHALHHAAAAARLAARGARLDHQPRPAGDGRRVALVRLARLDRAAARAGPARASPRRAR